MEKSTLRTDYLYLINMKLKEALLWIWLLSSVVSYWQTKQELISNFTKVDNAWCVSNAYWLDEIWWWPTVYTNWDEVIIVENSLTENDARSTIKYNIWDNSLELDTYSDGQIYQRATINGFRAKNETDRSQVQEIICDKIRDISESLKEAEERRLRSQPIRI